MASDKNEFDSNLAEERDVNLGDELEGNDDAFDSLDDWGSVDSDDNVADLDHSDLDDDVTAVASSKGQRFLAIFICVSIVVIASYFILFRKQDVVVQGDNDREAKKDSGDQMVVNPPSDNKSNNPWGVDIDNKVTKSSNNEVEDGKDGLEEVDEDFLEDFDKIANKYKPVERVVIPDAVVISPDTEMMRQVQEYLENDRKNKEFEKKKILELIDAQRNAENNITSNIQGKVDIKGLKGNVDKNEDDQGVDGVSDVFAEDELTIDGIEEDEEDEEDSLTFTEEELALLSTPMVVMNGGGGLEVGEDNARILKPSAAAVSVGTRIQNPEYTVLSGKVIDVVLETAIDTSLDGYITAIVSRDVYAAVGNRVLIPKGSRVIGKYGQVRGDRVLLTWNRLITPDNIDIAFDAPGTDQFGRSGISGEVDKRYFEILNNVALYSLVSVGAASILQGLQSGNDQEILKETRSDGSSSVRSSLITDAGSQIVDKVVTSLSSLLTESDTQPIIRINQGVLMKIFVNKDIKIINPDEYGVDFIK